MDDVEPRAHLMSHVEATKQKPEFMHDQRGARG